MMVVGLLVIVASWFVQRAVGRWSVTIPMAVLGIGALGVGVFPGSTGTPHAIFAMATFVSGAVAAITSARMTVAPYWYASPCWG